MANQLTSSGYGSNWGWWIVAIIVAILLTWWAAYATYHGSSYYGTGYNQSTMTPGTAATPGATGTNAAPPAGTNPATTTNR